METRPEIVKVGRSPFGAFAWYVPDAGFRWVEAAERPEFPADGKDPVPPFLVTNPGRLHHTNPLVRNRQRGLHRELAGLERHLGHEGRFKVAVLTFSGEHGKLGLPGAAWPEGATIVRAEPLSEWEKAVRHLAGLVTMWDTAAGGDETACRRFVKFHRQAPDKILTITWPDSSRDTPHVEHLILAESGFSEEQLVNVWKRRTGPDYAAMLRFACHVLVNQQLRGHVQVEALPFLRQFYLTPDSLLTAVYVLFAREMIGEQWAADQQGICKGCGAFFTGSKRSDREFCTYQCRKRYWWRMNRGSDAAAVKASRKAGSHVKASRSR